MYEAFFGFCRRPFTAAPRLEDYFPSATMEYARQTLGGCLKRGAGWGLAIGGVGLGKSLLCQLLAQDLQKTFQVVLLSGGGISRRRELWQNLLYTLGQPYRGMEEGELRLALVEYLSAQQKQTPGLVLLLDEAHLLSGKLLEDIRILSTLPGMSAEWFRLLLAGAPVLEERLSHPRLEALSQRITARCYLEPWNRAETQAYIRSQLQKASSSFAGEELPIPEQAAEAVFQATGGIPRLVNQLCDHVLLGASRLGTRTVDVRAVEEAWAELQQLPTPAAGVTTAGPKDSVIEFGVLDEEPEAVRHPFKVGPGCEEASESSPQSQGTTCFSTERWVGQDKPDSALLPSESEDGLGNRSVFEPGWENSSVQEATEHSGPEQEFYFGPVEKSSSDMSDATNSLPEDDRTEETERELPSAWRRLEEIEQALSEIGVSPEPSGKTACSESLSLPESKELQTAVFRVISERSEKQPSREVLQDKTGPLAFDGQVDSSGSTAEATDRPDARQKPEIELAFGKAESSASPGEVSGMENDPFAESFLEEEWIEDPYLQLGMEGQRPWSSICLVRKARSNSGNSTGETSPPTTSLAGHEEGWKLASSSPPLPTDVPSPPEISSIRREFSLSQDIAQSPRRWEPPEKAVGRQELPLIVIEEELEEPPPGPKCTAVPVARHEYRRLFARLRRG